LVDIENVGSFSLEPIQELLESDESVVGMSLIARLWALLQRIYRLIDKQIDTLSQISSLFEM
jgi:hypothetical protein